MHIKHAVFLSDDPWMICESPDERIQEYSSNDTHEITWNRTENEAPLKELLITLYVLRVFSSYTSLTNGKQVYYND
jgi:hypothetical protein